MKLVKSILESLFNIIHPLLQPEWVQKSLRLAGFKFPYYRFAQKLNYRGLVPFTVNGTKLYMQSYNCPFEMFIFWFGIFGYWEPTQLKVWSRLVKEADIILDIGANNGIYSLIASTNKSAQIFAFEPVPAVIEMLRKNVSLNNSNYIEVKPLLVGDSVGQSILYIPREGWVDVASLDKEFAGSVYGEGTKLREFSCAMTSVDVTLEESGWKPGQSVLCKIDVEQAEDLVLRGMEKILHDDNLQFIIELLNVEQFFSAQELIPKTYNIYAIDEAKKSVYSVTEFTLGATNYLFTKTDSKQFKR